MIVFARSLPNLLGVFRIFTTPLLVWLILRDDPVGFYGAVVLLLIMAASDIADGPLARRMKVVSPLGVFLDTISDKIFVAGALIPMVQVGLLSSWIALLIIVRDFAVSGLRSFAAAEGEVISARQWGKQKLVITVAAIIWLLLAAAYNGQDSPVFEVRGDRYSGIAYGISWLLSLWPISMFLTVVWTIFSGVEYFWKAWPLLSGKIALKEQPAPATSPKPTTLKPDR
jgi:CDP-diacylglycerol---glycerol-3-phosphate 3-phosphatidyltransferase